MKDVWSKLRRRDGWCELYEKISAFADRIALTPAFLLTLLAMATLVTLLRIEVAGAFVFVLLLCFLLAFCRNTLATTFPFLLLCIFVLTQDDSFKVYIRFIWMVIPAAAALLAHFLIKRPRFELGRGFYPILAISVAMALGGIGVLSLREYFAPVALFYTFGLGFGMLVAYLLLKPRFSEKNYPGVTDTFLRLFYLAGVFCCIFIVVRYIEMWDRIWQATSLDDLEFRSSNNIATFLMFFLPVPFYYALKNKWHLLAGIGFYIFLILSTSRGGFVMGSAELFLCLIFFCAYQKPGHRLIPLLLCIGGAIAVGILFLLDLDALVVSDDVRVQLLLRAKDLFLKHPIFGHGFAYSGNSDLYDPKQGAFYWYHMSIPQIVAGFGIVGILAFGYLYWYRAREVFRRPEEPRRLVLGLSYAGIFLMSLVNPGEFCPVPYQFLAVLLFVLLENNTAIPPVAQPIEESRS